MLGMDDDPTYRRVTFCESEQQDFCARSRYIYVSLPSLSLHLVLGDFKVFVVRINRKICILQFID